MKEILGELESFDDDNDSDSAPDLSETNSNDASKVDLTGLPIKNDFNKSSDDLVMFVKAVPKIDSNETID